MLSASNGSGSHLGPRDNGSVTPIARQVSIYSLTLDELQNNCEPGKHFGSMNMDEFLKNVWTAEETQAMAAVMTSAAETNSALLSTAGSLTSGLVRQSSLLRQVPLPRTLSRKTVDEVWKDIQRGSEPKLKEQLKLTNYGEMTLEDFLVKAGVVRDESEEDLTTSVSPSNLPERGFPQRAVCSSGGIFQQATSRTVANHVVQMETSASQTQLQQKWLNYHLEAATFEQHQLQHQFLQQQAAEDALHQHGNQFSQQHTSRTAAAVLSSSGRRVCSSLVALPGTPSESGVDVSSDGAAGHGNGLTLSPAVNSSDVDTRCRKRNLDGTVEKTVERRQRRMIKNRESAARSRARKQAYTVELEAEVTSLKEENTRLKKQQILKKLIPVSEASPPRKSLRRTRTNSW